MKTILSLLIFLFSQFSYSQIATLFTSSGSSGNDQAKSISCNSTGTIIGYDFSGNSITGSGSTIFKSNDALTEIALIKYDINGTVTWSSKIGLLASTPVCNNKKAFLDVVEMNASGEVFVAGRFQFQDLSVNGTHFLSKSCDFSSDIFIAKYSSTGTVLWLEKLETSNTTDRIVDLEITSSGDLIVTGNYWSKNLNWQSNTLNRTARIASFISSINQSTGQINWIKSFNGGLTSKEIKTDSNGNIYWLTNCTSHSSDIDGTIIDSKGKLDIVLAKFNPSGVFQQLTQLGGKNNDEGTSLIIDSNDNPWICGRYNSLTLDGTSLSNQAHENKYSSFLIGLDQSLAITFESKLESNGVEGVHALNLISAGTQITLISLTDGTSIDNNGSPTGLNGDNVIIYNYDLTGNVQGNDTFNMQKPGLCHSSASTSNFKIFLHAQEININGTSTPALTGTGTFVISVD